MNDLTFAVRGAIYEVYKELGPGLLESVYEAALVHELTQRGFNVRCQVAVPVYYKAMKLDIGFRMDLLVEDSVIVEIKSVENLHDVHKKQLMTYLKLANKKIGFLINFNSAFLKDKETFIRIVNNY